MPIGRVVILCLLTAAIISGCGRRGGLERPSEPKTQANTDTTTITTEPTTEPARPYQKKKAPERPFILDGLI